MASRTAAAAAAGMSFTGATTVFLRDYPRRDQGVDRLAVPGALLTIDLAQQRLLPHAEPLHHWSERRCAIADADDAVQCHVVKPISCFARLPHSRCRDLVIRMVGVARYPLSVFLAVPDEVDAAVMRPRRATRWTA